MEYRNSLEYTCPSHGGWGMVRIAMLIPESHQLFVCPSACGRHGALGAIQQGLKGRLSYLYLDESDVISGYDEEIYAATEELFGRLKDKPKVLVVFVSCLDDLIGTDSDAVIDELSRRYPDVQFRMGHMNPIKTDSDEPPLVNTWKNVYSLMEYTAEQRKPGINMLGNYVPADEQSEIYEVMRQLGVEVYHIGNLNTYEELKDMGNNALNLLLTYAVEKVAVQLKRTQGMEYLKAPVSYHFSEINAAYRAMIDKLKEAKVIEPDDSQMAAVNAILEESENKAKEAIAKAKETLGDTKIYIDYSAFADPFSAARFLHEQGFSIERVYAKDIDEKDEELQWIRNETEIDVINIKNHNIVNEWKERDDSLSIGLEAAYVSGSRYVVPVFQNEKMYGYHGVCLLMEQMMHSLEEEADLKQVINQAGLVV